MNIQKEEILKFYILVPVYKAEKYIRQCVESVLNQTYTNFEAILVDDGSPDRSGNILDEYAEVEPRIHVIHKKNEGQLSARQAGITYVKQNFSEENAFFVFLDSDDYLQLDALERIAETISQNDCDLVVYQLQSVCNGNVLRPHFKKPYTGVITDKRELYKIVFSSMEYNSMCRKAISCALLQDENWRAYYAIRHGEDLLHSIPVYKECQKAVFIEDVLYNYRVNPTSVTHSVSVASFTVDSTVRRTVWDFLQKENVFTEQDCREYLALCRRFLRSTVLRIGTFPTNQEVIFDFFEKIKRDRYYCMLLEHAQNDRILFWLKKGKYRKIIAYARVRKALSKCYYFLNKNRNALY